MLQVSFSFSAKAQNNNGSAVHNTMALGKQTNLHNIYLEILKTISYTLAHLSWNIRQEREKKEKV